MLARGALLALPDDGRGNGRRALELARRAVRSLRGRARHRTGDFLFRAARRRGASGRPRARWRCTMKLVHGIIAMLVTPFTGDYQLNEEALRKEVRWALDHGADGIVATPSIGEFLHLSEAERTRAFEVTLEETRRRPGVPAVAMTSGATTLETLRYAKIAARIGYDAQQVIPPYYWRCGEAEVEKHYRMVAEAGDLPVVIYHNPAL